MINHDFSNLTRGLSFKEALLQYNAYRTSGPERYRPPGHWVGPLTSIDTNSSLWYGDLFKSSIVKTSLSNFFDELEH